MDTKKIPGTPPIENERPQISTQQEKAAGWPAIQASLHHLREEMTFNTAFNTLFQLNQVGGFDCTGCAWPDPKERSRLGEYCENGVKALAEEATTNRVDPAFFARHSVQELAGWSDYQLGKSGRVTHPMIRRAGEDHYQPLSWEDAFRTIADELRGLASPDEAIFYTSGRTSNEAAFLYQLFVRQFGTNNLPDCSNMCHESSGTALAETVGIGKGSVTLEDFYITDLILVIGQNPGTNHPRMLNALEKAKKAGARIISINPIPEAGLIRFKNPQKISGWLGQGTKLTDLYLQVKVNEDIALLKAIMKILLDKEQNKPGSIFDASFIQKNTTEYEKFINDLHSYSTEELITQSGLEAVKVYQAAEMIAGADKMIACWAMGLTQHENGVDNIREVVNLLLLKGSIGKPGAGTCPVRGHSNVQGDRTMGIWESPKPAFLEKIRENFGFEPPRRHGYNTVQAIRAMHEGKAGVFFAMGGNFISATPDTDYTAEALQNCKLTVQVSTKLNRSHLVGGQTAIILPCLGRTEIDRQAAGEQFVSVENSMGIVHSSQGRLQPASEHLLSEPQIIARLATAVFGQGSPVDWTWYAADYGRIRQAIEETVPGFDRYNDRIKNPGGFLLPNGAREGKFHTDSGKAKFTLNPPPQHRWAEGTYMMMTIRSHDQFNTTIYGLDDRYRGVRNARRIVFMNPDDMARDGINPNDLVDLTGEYRGAERTAPKFLVVPYPIARQCVATYFPEANVLVPIDSYARKSETPASKSVVIRIKKSEGV